MKKMLLVLILAFIILPIVSRAEDLTITTYYPSPFGVYNEMRAKRVALGESYISLTQYAWSGSPTNTINTDADLIVEGRVGINTFNPQSALQVNGGVQVGTDAAGCNASKAGTMRYQGANIEYCNGVSWSSIGGSRVMTGSYIGNGVNNRNITGVGFRPKLVIIFPLYGTDGADEWVVLTDQMTTSPDSQGQQSQGLLSLDADGFTVSNSTNVNWNTQNYSYIAMIW